MFLKGVVDTLEYKILDPLFKLAHKFSNILLHTNFAIGVANVRLQKIHDGVTNHFLLIFQTS